MAMFLFIHVLLGTLVGISFSSAAIVFLLGFLSHFLLDVIPHWDNNFDIASFKKYFHVRIDKLLVFIVLADWLFSIFLIFLLYDYFSTGLVIIGAFGAILPDALKIGYFTPLRNKRWFRKHLLFHAHIQKDVGLAPGIATQLVALAILLKLLFF